MRYLAVSLVLGVTAVWASENLFWLIPPPDLTLAGWLITVAAYSVASAAALSLILWTGVQGWAAVFLGGAFLGYAAEGMIVGTIYDALPIQLVWTPLAWHALISAGLFVGLARRAMAVGWRIMLWTATGLALAFWAQYWPSERPILPDRASLALYLCGPAVLVTAGHILLDRIGPVTAPKGWQLWIAPALMLLVWLVQAATLLDPRRLILIPILALLIWIARRLGRDGPLQLGTPQPIPHHALLLLVPAIVTLVAPIGWASDWGTLEANLFVAFASGLISLGLLIRLIWWASTRPVRY